MVLADPFACTPHIPVVPMVMSLSTPASEPTDLSLRVPISLPQPARRSFICQGQPGHHHFHGMFWDTPDMSEFIFL